MLIKSFSTEQFAGINNKRVGFSDGLNVILGNNETGKSTIISAMYYALTKPVKISRKSKSDKSFLNNYFPTGGENTIDASIEVEKGGRVYDIEKIWDKEDKEGENFKVKIDNSDVLRGNQAEEELKKILEYGEAAYGNLIFGRQNNESEILDWCKDFFSSKSSGRDDIEEAKKKITEAISAAGGISLEKLVNIIDEEISKLASNWDYEKDRPKSRIQGGRWSRGNGTIIEKYYDYQDARGALSLEKEHDKKIKLLLDEKSKLEVEKQNKEGEVERLLKQGDSINAKQLLSDDEGDLKKWRRDDGNLKILNPLRQKAEEKANRDRKDGLDGIIREAGDCEKKCSDFRKEIDRYPNIEKDLEKAVEDERIFKEISGRLTSAKLRASFAVEDGNRINVKLADGTVKDIVSKEVVDIDGYVDIDIPGIAKIRVAPQELDVDKLESEKAEKAQSVESIIKKYSVDSVKELNDLYKGLEGKKIELKGEQAKKEHILKGKTIDELKDEASEISINPEIRISETLEEDIDNALSKAEMQSRPISEAVAILESHIKGYEDKHGTIGKLERKIDGYKNEIGDSVPAMSKEEYNEKIGTIKRQIKIFDNEIQKIVFDLADLSKKQKEDISELEMEADEKKQEWIDEKRKYEYYCRIKKDFNELASGSDGKYEEFYNKFDEYLNIITDDRLSFIHDERGLCIKSDENEFEITKEFLSEGTKKTLLLAFRLAMLHYFFPDGQGFIVLDDDLIDMDPGRRKRSAALIQDFAKDNQVIITTCDPAVADVLGGNRIDM